MQSKCTWSIFHIICEALGNPGNLKATVNITETEAETKPENPVDTEMNSSQKNQSG